MESIFISIAIVGVVGLLAAVLLSVASTLFAVETNEKEELIRDVLPGANCGSCGYSGCDAYAKALANEEGIAPNLCRPGGQHALLGISNILGVEAEEIEEVAAFVSCQGDCNTCRITEEYQGIQSCAAAKMIYGGPYGCNHGCLGLGDCQKVCESGAIEVINNISYINRDKCIACGKCVKVCPNQVIKLLPKRRASVVPCSNEDKGVYVRKECQKGCIACMKCEKNCPNGAIKVENNLAHIDYSKCTGCGKCADNCPVGCLKML